jgi:hypothetical protein
MPKENHALPLLAACVSVISALLVFIFLSQAKVVASSSEDIKGLSISVFQLKTSVEIQALMNASISDKSDSNRRNIDFLMQSLGFKYLSGPQHLPTKIEKGPKLKLTNIDKYEKPNP